MNSARRLPLLLAPLLLAGCFTDAATRLAYDLESAAGKIGAAEGAKWTVAHRTPSRPGECDHDYKVQLDQVGAIIVWCRDQAGTGTLSSHSTSYHARFVATPRTYILDKKAGDPLLIDLERRGGRVLVVDAR
jgi:hypothetical protein